LGSWTVRRGNLRRSARSSAADFFVLSTDCWGPVDGTDLVEVPRACGGSSRSAGSRPETDQVPLCRGGGGTAVSVRHGALVRRARVPALVVAPRANPTTALDAGRLLWSVVLVGAFFYVTTSVGNLQQIVPGTELIHLGFFSGLWTASALLVLPLGIRVSVQRDEQQRKPGWVVPVGLALAGLALIEVDRRALAGLYAPVHLWLIATGMLCLDTGALILTANRRGRGWTVGGVLSIAFAAGCAGTLWVCDLGTRSVVRSTAAQAAGGLWMLTLVAPQTDSLDAMADGRHPALRHGQYLDEDPPIPDLNLLLITVDTLRADAPELEDDSGRLMPHMERMGSQAVRFSRALAQSTRTATSLGAISNGRYCENIRWRTVPWSGRKILDPEKGSCEDIQAAGKRCHNLTVFKPAKAGTLAQRLDGAALRTMAVLDSSGNGFFSRKSPVRLGYQISQEVRCNRQKRPCASKAVKAALGQIDRAKSETWFLWIHLYDPHQWRGKHKEYRRLVAGVDKALGELWRGLQDRGQWEQTAIFLTADHGESFGEHHSARHGSTLYDEQVRVPLYVRVPGVAPRVESRAVALIDVTATLLVLAGADTSGLDGVNLLPLLTRGEYPKQRPVFLDIETYKGHSLVLTADAHAVEYDGYKFIVDRLRGTEELFDLAVDPAERESLVGSDPARAESSKAILQSYMAMAEQERARTDGGKYPWES
jgi:hypothetical protein